jgi:outer membrane protein assembly factor BamB
VADGKVCTFGVRAVLSCLEAASGKVLWRKQPKDKAWPKYFTASSPIIIDGKCIAYLGGPGEGEVLAYDLASGKQEWKWTGAGPPYGSPVVITVAGTKQLVTPTERSLVGIGVADGKLLWENGFTAKYMNGTPIVDGTVVFYSAQNSGTIALKIEKEGDGFKAKELWKKAQSSHNYNTPVLKDGMLFGLAPAGKGAGGKGAGGKGGKKGMGKGGATNLFCMNAATGDVLWTDTTSRGECGTVLDAGPVLLSLSSNSELVVFEPSKAGYKEIARYKVADTPTWAYPVVAGNRVFVKGKDTLTLWTID